MTIFSRWFLVAGVIMAGSLNLRADQMQYEVAGPWSARAFNLEEHFRPSNVYHYAPGSDRVLLDSNGQVVPIPSDPNNSLPFPRAWNQAGEIVGDFSYGQESWVGFSYKNGQMTYFAPKLDRTSQSAMAINNLGQAVGGATLWHDNAYLYSNGVKTDLGGLPGNIYNIANDINDSGVIVGRSSLYAGYQWDSFVIKDGQMYDLTKVTSGLGKNLTIDNALAVTSDGWILATARDFTTTSWNPRLDLWLKPLTTDSTDSSSTVIDTTDGGFWTTPTNTDGLNDPATTTGSGSSSTPQPVPVPEPATYLIWGSLALLLVWKRLA